MRLGCVLYVTALEAYWCTEASAALLLSLCKLLVNLCLKWLLYCKHPKQQKPYTTLVHLATGTVLGNCVCKQDVVGTFLTTLQL